MYNKLSSIRFMPGTTFTSKGKALDTILPEVLRLDRETRCTYPESQICRARRDFRDNTVLGLHIQAPTELT